MTAKEYLKENDIWSTTLEDLKIVDVSGHKFSVDYLMEQYANERAISIITKYRDRLGKELHSDIVNDIQTKP